MSRQAETSPKPLAYSTPKTRRPWKVFLLGVLTTPAAYLLLYLVLRATGVYHAYYSQGSWEIEGWTGIYILDVPFFPMKIFESNLQNRLRWLREPTGG
jgi:hypothetical protein